VLLCLIPTALLLIFVVTVFGEEEPMWKWSDDMSTGSKDFHQCIHHEMYLWCPWCKERAMKEYVIFVWDWCITLLLIQRTILEKTTETIQINIVVGKKYIYGKEIRIYTVARAAYNCSSESQIIHSRR
jgi:hypothetical protein